METTIVTMTPEWAAHILETSNHNNRKIRRTAVKRIAQSIEHGLWKLTHQGIALDKEGNLQDGQHRLHAIILANKSVEILLTTGCEPNSFGVLDCGVARTASDSLDRINGKNTSKAAAGIKIFYLYKTFPNKVWSNTDSPPQTQIVAFYQQNKGTIDWGTEYATQTVNSYRLINPSALVAFMILGAEHRQWSKCEEFCHLLKSPVMQDETSPILAYRSLLERRTIGNHNLQQRSLASIIKCFNYWAQEIPLKQFKPPTITPMPTIEVHGDSYV